MNAFLVNWLDQEISPLTNIAPDWCPGDRVAGHTMELIESSSDQNMYRQVPVVSPNVFLYEKKKLP